MDAGDEVNQTGYLGFERKVCLEALDLRFERDWLFELDRLLPDRLLPLLLVLLLSLAAIASPPNSSSRSNARDPIRWSQKLGGSLERQCHR